MFGSPRRRTSPRHSCHYFAHFRHVDAGFSGPSGLCVTRDLSHDGVYFIAFDPALRERMRLLLRFSYHERPTVKERDYLVEIVRVSSLFARRYGVGARLVFEAPVGPQLGLFVAATQLRKPAGPPSELPHVDLYA